MPKVTKISTQGATSEPTHEEMTTSSQDEHSSSDQEPDPEITFHPSRQPQPVPSMLMPYILKVPRWTGQLMMGFAIDF